MFVQVISSNDDELIRSVLETHFGNRTLMSAELTSNVFGMRLYSHRSTNTNPTQKPRLTSEQYMQFLKQIDLASDEHSKLIQEMIDCALCCHKLCDDAGLDFDDTLKKKFDPKSVSKTTCNHLFHTRCIVHYFEHQNGFQICPLCRKRVREDEAGEDQK